MVPGSKSPAPTKALLKPLYLASFSCPAKSKGWSICTRNGSHKSTAGTNGLLLEGAGSCFTANFATSLGFRGGCAGSRLDSLKLFLQLGSLRVGFLARPDAEGERPAVCTVPQKDTLKKKKLHLKITKSAGKADLLTGTNLCIYTYTYIYYIYIYTLCITNKSFEGPWFGLYRVEVGRASSFCVARP